MDLPFSDYVRKPFPIKALLITEENLDEVAQYIGHIRTAANGKRYIEVDRTKVPGSVKVFPGSWLTDMGGNLRCYTDRTFHFQFTPNTRLWEDMIKKANNEPVSDMT